jgi:hypothetical protein
MFDAGRTADMYRRFLGPLARPITLLRNNGTGFTAYPEITGFVSKYKESDLVSGGSIQLGDVRLIILTEDIPAGITSLGLGDRIVIKNRFYGVVHWDAYSRKVGDTGVAIEVAVRGGGVYVLPEQFTIISEIGETLITEDSAFDMVTE